MHNTSHTCRNVIYKYIHKQILDVVFACLLLALLLLLKFKEFKRSSAKDIINIPPHVKVCGCEATTAVSSSLNLPQSLTLLLLLLLLLFVVCSDDQSSVELFRLFLKKSRLCSAPFSPLPERKKERKKERKSCAHLSLRGGAGRCEIFASVCRIFFSIYIFSLWK